MEGRVVEDRGGLGVRPAAVGAVQRPSSPPAPDGLWPSALSCDEPLGGDQSDARGHVLAGAIDRLVASQVILFPSTLAGPGHGRRAESYSDIHSCLVAIPA